MECNKCNQDKPDTEFQTYFHSTQNVYRTRRQCNSCFNQTKKESRMKKELRVCIHCNEEKEVIDFPNYKSFSANDRRKKICKACSSIIEKLKGKHTKREENGELVSNKPNTYISEQQRIDGFQLMEALGFTFVPETGRWHKEGFKNPDGTFVRIEENKRLQQERRLKEIEDLDVWSKITYLREQGFTINQIANDTGVNITALNLFLRHGKKVKFRN